MQVKIITVGRLKEKYLKSGVAEYLKRLTYYAKVEIVEVPDEPASEKASASEELQIKEKEAEKIRRRIKEGTYLIALAIDGKMLSSEELAQTLEDLALRGQSNVTFLIGGSLGLDESLLGQADFQLSLSKMTFPHQLTRVILLEQIYRAFKIQRGEPYHK